ncbi:hypothetical protein [Sphingomonas japonica]|nr:hypothetical protein [Sphingomonas japonica]
MGKATAQRKPPVITPSGEDATPFRLNHNEACVVEALRVGRERMGKARCIVPPIETLYASGKLSEGQYYALRYYGEQARLAQRSLIKDSLDREIGGGGDHYSAELISAEIETGRIERELGALREIAYHVAVEEKTLATWCIQRHGGRERYGPGGKFVALVPIREKENMRLALIELKSAAGKIVHKVQFRY